MRFALLSLALLALPAQAQAQTSGDVVVTAAPTPEKPSTWSRADTGHAVIHSDGSAKELTRVARTIERLHQLLAKLYRTPAADPTKPLHITLVSSWDRMSALDAPAPIADDGAYLAGHAGQRLYAQSADGPVLVMARADQLIDLNTRRRFDVDCGGGDAGEGAAVVCLKRTNPFYPPVTRQWEAALYSAYTQHFLNTYVPAGYPRWYLDGVGELFSTITVRDNGAIDYARPPAGYWDVLSAYGVANLPDVLASRPSTGINAPVWTLHSAWLIAHFLLFSESGKAWQAPFGRYMTAVHQGMPLTDAAKLLGSPARLQRALRSYVDRGKQFAHADPDAAGRPDPLVTPLSADAGAVFEARLALDLAPATIPAEPAARLRERLAMIPSAPEVQALRTEVACRTHADGRCVAEADRRLALAPDDAAALAWKGAALTRRAFAASPADRRADLAAGRAMLERAMALDDSALAPRIAYFDSFVLAGEPASDAAIRALSQVIRMTPAAAEPRLALGRELLRRGDTDLARRLLAPFLNGSGDSPHRRAAQALFASPVQKG